MAIFNSYFDITRGYITLYLRYRHCATKRRCGPSARWHGPWNHVPSRSAPAPGDGPWDWGSYDDPWEFQDPKMKVR